MTLSGILLFSINKTKKVLKKQNLTPALSRLRAVLSAVALIALISGAAVAHADQFDEQIKALQSQNNAAVRSLTVLADRPMATSP